MSNKCNLLQLFPKATAARPPGTHLKRCASKFPATWAWFHPDWTKWRLIHAHFSFQILTYFTNLCSLPPLPYITMGQVGNTIYPLFLY